MTRWTNRLLTEDDVGHKIEFFGALISANSGENMNKSEPFEVCWGAAGARIYTGETVSGKPVCMWQNKDGTWGKECNRVQYKFVGPKDNAEFLVGAGYTTYESWLRLPVGSEVQFHQPFRVKVNGDLFTTDAIWVKIDNSTAAWVGNPRDVRAHYITHGEDGSRLRVNGIITGFKVVKLGKGNANEAPTGWVSSIHNPPPLGVQIELRDAIGGEYQAGSRWWVRHSDIRNLDGLWHHQDKGGPFGWLYEGRTWISEACSPFHYRIVSPATNPSTAPANEDNQKNNHEENDMQFTSQTVKLIDGYRAQVLDQDTQMIVWESTETFTDDEGYDPSLRADVAANMDKKSGHDKARKAAQDRIIKAKADLFADGTGKRAKSS